MKRSWPCSRRCGLGTFPSPPRPLRSALPASMALRRPDLSVLRQVGLDQLIYSRKEPWREDILALIVGRIVYQGSKLALTGVYQDSALWELCGHPAGKRPDVEKHAYLPMDRLLDRQESIQKQLAMRHFKDGCLIYYDMTSSYAEGEYEDSELVAYGHNRDCKRGHAQIAVGLLTTAQGCPVAVRVFRGNTADQTTVLDQAKTICDEYGVQEVIFVGDRGMLTPRRIEELHALGYKTLTALTHPQMRELLQRRVVQLELFSEEADEARRCYKDLMHVEQAFRNLKTVSLEMRPFHHHLDDRIRSHVFVCMLAYYVQWQASQRLQPLFASDGKGKNRRWTLDRVFERRKGIRMQTLSVGGTAFPTAISSPDEHQRRILELLQVKL